jgi:hypothetical protein
VYIEPYPKRLAMTLHYDAVSESEEDDSKKLVFLQCSGVAPKHFRESVIKSLIPFEHRFEVDLRLS